MNSKKGLNPSLIGRENIEIILKLIQKKGSISRTEISETIGLSKTAVSSSVDQLLERNLIIEDKHKKYSKVGRKPKLLSINPDGKLFLSIDIGGTSVTYGFGKLIGKLKATKSTPTPDHWEKLYDDILHEVSNCKSWTGTPVENIDGMTIAVPGVVNEDGTVSYVPNISGLDEVKLGEKLGGPLKIPIFLENDVNASALGEYKERNNPNSPLVFIAIGTGVGGGINIDGELFRGSHNHAGEVGWMISNPDQMRFERDDSKGWLESRISGPDLVRRVQDSLQNSNADALTRLSTELNPEIILKNEVSSMVAENFKSDWILEIAMLITNIANLIDPELVVLGGGVSKTGGTYLEEIKNLVANNTQHTPKIDLSCLGEDAPLRGGLEICRNNIGKLLWE